MALFVLVNLASAFVQDFWMLLILRGVLGFASSALTVLPLATIRDRYSGGRGSHDQRHVTMPAMPGAGLAVIETQIILGAQEAFLDGPAQARCTGHFRKRGSLARMDEIIGHLARVRGSDLPMFCTHFADNGNCTRYNGMILSAPRQGRLGAPKAGRKLT